MAFENIECVNPSAATNPVPLDGVRVSARKLERKSVGSMVRFIKVQIGPDLARKLHLREEKHKLSVLFGTDNDAGMIKLSIDQTNGAFVASRAKNGSYSFTINAQTADGMFSLEFANFDRKQLEAVSPVGGGTRSVVFMASREMLEVED